MESPKIKEEKKQNLGKNKTDFPDSYISLSINKLHELYIY